jgi:hypothetical protein
MPLPGHDRLLGQPIHPIPRGQSTSPTKSAKKKLSTSFCTECHAPTWGEKTNLSANDKVSMTLGYIRIVLKTTFGDILEQFFAPPDAGRTPEHTKVLEGLMDGRGTRFGTLVSLAFDRASETAYRTNNATCPVKPVNPGADPATLAHAHPSMIAWAIRLVTGLVKRESDAMVEPAAGFQMGAGPAKRKAGAKRRPRRSAGKTAADLGQNPDGGPSAGSAESEEPSGVDDRGYELEDASPEEDLYASWKRVAQFSFAKMEDTQKERAPVTTHLLRAYQDPDYTGNESASDRSDRKYRPYHLAVTQQIASMTFSRAWTNGSLFAMVRGIWMFASCAAQSAYRVDSRIGLSVSYETVRTALKSLTRGALDGLREGLRLGSGVDWWFNGDNVQAYMKQGAQRLGFVNRMIKGYAGCAIRMHDVKPGAMDLDKYLEKQARMDRKKLTVDVLLADLDQDHLDRIAHFSFLSILVNHVPTLALYSADVIELSKKLEKNQIDPHRLSDVVPLKTEHSVPRSPGVGIRGERNRIVGLQRLNSRRRRQEKHHSRRERSVGSGLGFRRRHSSDGRHGGARAISSSHQTNRAVRGGHCQSAETW